MRKNIFESVHIPPDPGDGGGALGAAIYLQSRVGKLSMEGQISPYLGVSYDEKSALELLPDLKLAELGKHRSTPSELGAVSKISVQSFQPKDPALLTGICEDLSNGKIVGWLQGSFENGPRALGNRSILADPRNKNTSRRISRHVKARATFRPYACSLNSDQLQNVFSFESSVVPPGMRHMSSTHQVRERCMNQLTEVLHIDGSTRPQVLEETENPIFYRLLKNWGEASGCPALLNTSFNESGYPMISSDRKSTHLNSSHT